MNLRHLWGVMAAPLLFLPATRAQTTSVVAGGKIVLLPTEKKEAGPRPIAPTSLQDTGTKESELPVHFPKKQFVLLGAGVYAAAAADMHQTLHVRHYSWWWETDPLARPFVHLPAPAYYASGFALATGVNWLSWKMGRSRRWHKLAPLPQLFAIGGNTYGFKSNRY